MIGPFRGEYAFLSNFFPYPFVFKGRQCKSSEHPYQAAKTLDPIEQDYIYSSSTAAVAKRRGKTVTIRDDWEQVKYDVMKDVLRAKFSDPFLKELLLKTGQEELVEKNTWRDTTWGQIQAADGTWVGQNLLGKALMEVRYELTSLRSSFLYNMA